MLLNIIYLIAGIILLYFGAEGLVRGSSSLALRLKLTPLIIGLTVVALGTSMPEMVVSVGAALSGSGGIAAGNALGSNIANIALILGISAIICPLAVHVRIVRIDLPFLVLFSFIIGFMVWDQRIGRLEGTFLVAAIIAYTVFSIISARKETAEAHSLFDQNIPQKQQSIPLSLVFAIVGLGLLVAGAQLLVTGAVAIATTIGLSEVVIGLTVVAMGTSLPELATSVVAALKKETDIAVGNVVGSCVFNLLGILGVSSLVAPLENLGLSLVDIILMIGLAIILLPLARTGWRLSRWEGVFLLFTYVAYLVYLLR